MDTQFKGFEYKVSFYRYILLEIKNKILFYMLFHVLIII